MQGICSPPKLLPATLVGVMPKEIVVPPWALLGPLLISAITPLLSDVGVVAAEVIRSDV